MVEQPHSSECHNHIVLITLFNDQIIPDGTARFGDVLHTRCLCPLDIVREREKGIRTQCNPINSGQEGLFIFFCQTFRLLRKIILPIAICTYILLVLLNRSFRVPEKGYMLHCKGCCGLVHHLLPQDGLNEAPTTALYSIVNQLDTARRFMWNKVTRVKCVSGTSIK